MTNDDYLFFKNTFSNAGALDRIISFINTTEDPSVERSSSRYGSDGC